MNISIKPVNSGTALPTRKGYFVGDPCKVLSSQHMDDLQEVLLNDSLVFNLPHYILVDDIPAMLVQPTAGGEGDCQVVIGSEKVEEFMSDSGLFAVIPLENLERWGVSPAPATTVEGESSTVTASFYEEGVLEFETDYISVRVATE